MLKQSVLEMIASTAKEIGVEPAALAAVVHIESGQRIHAVIDGRPEPLIRFEGHYFDRRLSGAKRARARAEGLASPVPGAVSNPPGQPARWRLLKRAAAIDRKAAYESVSWGVGQVMGGHWAWLGYRDVKALVAEARAGIDGQLRLMARFISKAGLVPSLQGHDWAAFACGYNGPAFRRNAYDAKLAKAYARYAGLLAAGPAHRRPVLRLGARGAAVRELQDRLNTAGHRTIVDGVFGPATERAVGSFQADRGFVADGVAGRATWRALTEQSSCRGLAARFRRWLGKVMSGFRRVV